MSIELLSNVWTHLTEIQPSHGEGIYLYDSDGNRYIDFTCGIGVTNTGHCEHSATTKVVRLLRPRFTQWYTLASYGRDPPGLEY